MISQHVDLERYPFLEFNTPAYRNLVARSQQELRETGLCVLEGFIRPDALTEMREQAAQTEPLAYYAAIQGNAYLKEKDPSLPADHPLNLEDRTTVGAVAYDQIASSDVIAQIYHCPEFLRFLGDATGRAPIYYYECPMGKINYAIMRNGDYLRWHFDQSDFVVSIPIQAPEAGGKYEYVYNIRTPGDENYDGVKKLLKGDHRKVQVLNTPPGSLVLFEGRYTIHRVTEVKGDTIRIVALLGFADRPGVTSTDFLRQMRYGRAR